MDPGSIAVFIPIVSVAGFFCWMITLTLTRAHTARLKAQAEAARLADAGPGHEELLAALEDVRREVAELAERVDFTERLLAQGRSGEEGKLLPGDRRTGSK